MLEEPTANSPRITIFARAQVVRPSLLKAAMGVGASSVFGVIGLQHVTLVAAVELVADLQAIRAGAGKVLS
jgi:hypothetical protein